MEQDKHNKERENLVELQMTLTDFLLKKAKGEIELDDEGNPKGVSLTAQEVNAITKHLQNNDINVHNLIDVDNEEKKDNAIDLELPEDYKKTGFKKVSG